MITDSPKKHHRTSDGEAEETTKRRKHKHHHRSKYPDEEKRMYDVMDMLVDEFPAMASELKKQHDDMEEGEIVEEDGEKVANHLGVSGVDTVDCPDSTGALRGKMGRRDSDAIQINNVPEIDQTGLGDGVNGMDVVSISDNSEDTYKRSIRSPYLSRRPGELSPSKRSGSYYSIDRSGSQSRSDVEDADTLKVTQLQDNNHKINRKYAYDSRNKMSFRLDHSEHGHATRDRERDEEREPSVSYGSPTDRWDKKYLKEICHRDRDTEDMNRDCGHERERGSSRDAISEKDKKRSRTREQEKEKSRGSNKDQDRQVEWDEYGRVVHEREPETIREREKKHGRGREKEIDMNLHMENDKITSRTLERDRHKDAEFVDMHMERERDRYRIKEREREKERERGAERARDRGRERERSLDRSRDRRKEGNDKVGKSKDRSTEQDGEKERLRHPSNDRARERRRDREGSFRERENGLDRSRDRYRDSEDHHLARQHKYDGGSGKRHRQSEYKRDGNSYNNNQDRTKAEDTSRPHRSTNSFGGSEDTRKREEEEQEEYQEKISLQLAEEEEDDVNRIKEESRRRRQAILEKYKNMKLQDQGNPLSVDIQKDNDQEKLSSLQTEVLISPYEVADDKPDSSFAVAKSPVENGGSAAEHTGTRGLGEGTPKSERSDDMFCDDIFGETPTGVRKSGKRDGLPVERSGLHDNWDDAEGYYSYRFGELLDGRYEITAAHGKGVFSSVVRAKDLKAGNGEPEEVAIKIIRNNETMFKAGQSELIILKKLVGADPEDRRHCVRFLSSFKYRNHLCLVFESLHMNLREVLKKFGRNIGLKLTAVRAYAKQLLIALKHLRNCGVLHCDIKPDNMLVNGSKNVLKLCDFGNAMFAGKNEITPYLVSRFYRAPEIILGLPYDHPVDIWSIGCCLYELYTGKVLFPGATNNDMLRLHLELKGPFPKKMLRKGAFTEQHFDQDLNFLSLEDDPVSKKTIKRVMMNIKPKDVGSIITGSAGEDPKMLTNFKDMLDKIFMLDPDKRMTVSQALAHPFITGHLPGIMATHQCLDALKRHWEKVPWSAN
ncbi:unnamed protein product [Rhodiola kirilowii]